MPLFSSHLGSYTLAGLGEDAVQYYQGYKIQLIGVNQWQAQQKVAGSYVPVSPIFGQSIEAMNWVDQQLAAAQSGGWSDRDDLGVAYRGYFIIPDPGGLGYRVRDKNGRRATFTVYSTVPEARRAVDVINAKAAQQGGTPVATTQASAVPTTGTGWSGLTTAAGDAASWLTGAVSNILKPAQPTAQVPGPVVTPVTDIHASPSVPTAVTLPPSVQLKKDNSKMFIGVSLAALALGACYLMIRRR